MLLGDHRELSNHSRVATSSDNISQQSIHIVYSLLSHTWHENLVLSFKYWSYLPNAQTSNKVYIRNSSEPNKIDIDFGHNIYLFFLTRLHTALILLSRSIEIILKIFNKFDISHLSAKVTSINILVPLGFSHLFLF